MEDLYVAKDTQRLSSLLHPGAVSVDTRLAYAELISALSKIQIPDDLQETRDAYRRGDLGLPASPKSPNARTRSIDGPAGPIELRILQPAEVKGVYLHLHGGGWVMGANDTWDGQLEVIARESGMVCVSPNYRLAPEHPFPAAVDDCVAVAEWLIHHAVDQFGTSWLSIGGESAGSNLAASTLLRLRDSGHAHAFKAVSLLFGCFDLSLTPSVVNGKDAVFVSLDNMRRFTSAFAGGADLRDPMLSPLYADLHGLPPALFSVGSADPLIDDSLFMHMRWQAAGNRSDLAIFPGGWHGFNSFDSYLGNAANVGIARFLKSCSSK